MTRPAAAAEPHTLDRAAVSTDLDRLPRHLRITEAAAVARVSTRTIRRWASIGLVRVTKPAGGRVLVDRDSLRALLEGT
jgi:excisionase family DNA binding protein